MKYEPMPKLGEKQESKLSNLARGAIEAWLLIAAFMCGAYAIREVLRWVME